MNGFVRGSQKDLRVFPKMADFRRRLKADQAKGKKQIGLREAPKQKCEH